MPDLLLLRHAKSDWDANYGRDFDRPLNQRGRDAARTMGRFLSSQPPIERILASPARRVAETLDLAAREAGLPQPEWIEDLYGATQATVLRLVRAFGDERRVLVAGHNPVTHMLASALAAPDGSDDWHALQRKYPTGALVELRYERWSEVGVGAGRLVRFVRPRDL